MQVSTPMQVPVTSGTAPAGEQESKTVQAKSLKNDKLGVFAKMLEGLVQNPKQGETSGRSLGKPSKGDQAQGSPRVQGELTADPKTRKKVSGTPGEAKTKEAPDILDKNIRQDKSGFSETLVLLVPQGQEIDKPAIESVQKGRVLSSQIHSKEKKEGGSLQNPVSKMKPAASREELSLEGEIGNRSKTPPEAVVKADISEIKKDKSADKEGSRKTRVALTQTSRNPEGEAAQLSVNTEKEVRGGSKVGEPKGRDKRRDRGNVEVRDLRSWEVARQEPAQGSQLVGEVKPALEAKTVELAVDLSGGSKNREGIFREAAHGPAQAFEDILARELYQNLNGDIVRQAQVILKDHGEGTIRLALKPESLGNVKVQLEMTENKIIGHIIVESNEVLKAFEREIRSLEQAFKDSGFAGASLDMTLDSGNGGSGTDQGWREKEAIPFFSERFAASNYDAVSDRVEELMFGEISGSGFNMLV